MQADGLAPAINMNSGGYKLFGIVGDSRTVKLSHFSNYKLGSRVVYVMGSRTVVDSLCFPIRLQGKKSVVVCL